MLPPYFHIVTVLALILTLNQSNAFTTTTYTTPHQAKPTSIIANHISSNHQSSTSETSLGMTSLAAASSVSRRGFLRSAMVSCGGLVQHRSQLPIELAADKVKDDSLDDLLEMLFGDADDRRREHSSCLLSEAITTTTSWDTNINKSNACADIATHLPFELVERCILRRTSERR